MFLPDTKPETCATPQKSVDFILQPFLPTRGHLISQLAQEKITWGTHLRHLVTSGMGALPPSPHSLQGEGEVVLAGLAVAHQVTGLLAEPQQRLRVRPADGPVVPAAGGQGRAVLGTQQPPREGLCPGAAPMPAPPRGLQPHSAEGRGWLHGGWETRGRDKQAEMGSQGRKEEASLPRGSLVRCKGQAATPGRQDSPLALQGQGRVNPLPDKGARLSGQCLCALEAAGARPEGSPGLLLPAGRGAAIPQPLRWTCKTDTHHRLGS